ncbi:MAG: hypothetical protein A2Y10_05380 [Planctomycetes bacterium GWF2_41_51]|nr:MAG: hypothetical protein A2Y10_05380 [Planctomycetes bacterium GWF2_41_51]HBG26810.1 hypothetical protein [Phycisphaerales bacterium]
MFVGFDGRADLNISGGSLTLNAFRLGVDNGIGYVNLNSGNVIINGDTAIGDGINGIGTLTITSGTFTVANSAGSTSASTVQKEPSISMAEH